MMVDAREAVSVAEHFDVANGDDDYDNENDSDDEDDNSLL